MIGNASGIILNVIWIEFGEDIIFSFLECEIATKTIRSNWFLLPLTCRLPKGYVSHRILYLCLYQIVKINAIMQYKCDESVDTWRRRTNTNIESFQYKIYSLIVEAIIPLLSDKDDCLLPIEVQTFNRPRSRRELLVCPKSVEQNEEVLSPLTFASSCYSRRPARTPRTPERKGVSTRCDQV